MKFKYQILWITVSTLFFGLFQTGCTIRFVQSNEVAPPPNPNAAQIELRVRQQITRIDGALQSGNLDQYSAEGLAENDEMVRRMSSNDMAQNGGQDLNYGQTTNLNAMLDDNGQAISDAIARREAWIQGFQGGWNYDYGSPNDRYMFISKLHQDLYQQQTAVNTAAQSNQITQDQAQSMRIQINVVYNTEQNYYSQNRRMDLSKDQMIQLRRMVVSNNKAIHQGIYGNQSFNKNNPAWGNGPNDFKRHYSARPGNFGSPTSNNPGVAAANPAQNAPGGPQASQKPVLEKPANVPAQPAPALIPQAGNPVKPSTGILGITAKVKTPPAVKPTAKQAANPAAQPKLVSAEKLNTRIKGQNDRLFKANISKKISNADMKKVSDKRKVLSQTLAKDLALNHMKGVTPDQMSQLSKMADEIDRMLSPVSGKH